MTCPHEQRGVGACVVCSVCREALRAAGEKAGAARAAEGFAAQMKVAQAFAEKCVAKARQEAALTMRERCAQAVERLEKEESVPGVSNLEPPALWYVAAMLRALPGEP